MTTLRSTLLVAASALGLGLAASAASAATTVYSNTFDTGAPVGGLAGQNGFAGGLYANGNLGGAANGLSVGLSGLAAHSTLTLSFSLALVDSWDGAAGYSPYDDYFNVTLGGINVFKISVDNFGSGTPEIIPGTATGMTEGRFYGSDYSDSTFSVSFTVAHTGSTADLSFFADGLGWQGGSDESWAIDNLTITSDAEPSPAPVPLPAALPLLGAGIGALGLLRRRRKA